MKKRMMVKQFRNTNYFIGIDGAVYRKKNDDTLKELKVNEVNNHSAVTLYYDGERKNHLVGRLVAECFNDKYTDDCYISYRDNNRKNNNLVNIIIGKHPKKEYYYKVSNDSTFEIFGTFKEVADYLGYKSRGSVAQLIKSGKSLRGHKVEKIMVKSKF